MATIGSLSRLSSADTSASSADVVRHDDTRMTNARTPTAHASTHATAGSDPVAPSDIGAATSGHSHTGTYQPLDSDLTTIAGLTATTDSILQAKASAWTTRTPAQVKTDLALTKSDVGLGSVDNTADTAKPVSTAQQTALDGKQPIDSDLTAIAAIAPANDDVIQRKAGAWTNRTMAQLLTDLSAVPTSRTVTASTGLTGGGDLSANRSFAVSYGSSSGTAVQGNDTRVTADQVAGTASIRTLGTGSQQACAGNDARLSDSRAPIGSAGGALTGTYPNPGISVVPNAPVTLTDAATIATDASLGTLFRVSMSGNRTLGAPSNPTDGQRAIWEVTASSADRTLSLATGAGGFVFGSDITALSTTLSGKTDFIGGMYNSSANRWRVVAYVKGF